MENQKVLGMGLIGAGSSASNIAAATSLEKTIKIVAISNHNKDKAEELAKKYSIPFVTADYKEVCNRDDVDFVVISVPHALHYEMTIYALNHGKHVLVEKPIATKVEQAEKMISLARKKNLKFGVHFQRRILESVEQAKKIIDSGEIGKILQVNISVMWRRDIDYYKKSNWRGTWDMEGGGSLINQSIHTVDEMIYLVGDIKRLFGFWGHKVHDIEVDDNTCATFLFKNGVFGVLQTSTGVKSAFPAKTTIYGENGNIEIEGNILTVYKSDGTKERVDYAAKEGGQVASATDPKKFSKIAHRKMIHDFYEAIINDRDPCVSGEEGLKSLKVVRAVYESNGEKIIDL